MKWLEKIICRLIDKRMEQYESMLDIFEEKVRDLKNDLSLSKQDFDAFKSDYIRGNNEISSNFMKLDADIHNLREKLELDVRKNGFKVDEKDRLLRNDMELCFTGLVKNIDRKLELLGDKKGIVTDLLKRIAFLEGQKDVKIG